MTNEEKNLSFLPKKISDLKREINLEMIELNKDGFKGDFHYFATYEAFVRDVVLEVQYLRGIFKQRNEYPFDFARIVGPVRYRDLPCDSELFINRYEDCLDRYILNLGIRLYSLEAKRMISSALTLIYGDQKIEDVWNELLGFLVSIYNLEHHYLLTDDFVITHKKQRKRK